MSPVGGGGRYDGLLKAVGAPRNVPAVGGCHSHRAPARRRAREQVMSARLTFAVPSKGRLMEQTAEFLGQAGLNCARWGTAAAIAVRSKASTASTSHSSPPPRSRGAGQRARAHIGVTGEDLVRENISNADERVTLLKRCGFGRANVVVAVPTLLDGCQRAWPTSTKSPPGLPPRARPADPGGDEVYEPDAALLARRGRAGLSHRRQSGRDGRRPGGRSAEIIVDITTTGATLRANGLKVLSDGVILRSEANLIASKLASWSDCAQAAQQAILARLSAKAAEPPPPAPL